MWIHIHKCRVVYIYSTLFFFGYIISYFIMYRNIVDATIVHTIANPGTIHVLPGYVILIATPLFHLPPSLPSLIDTSLHDIGSTCAFFILQPSISYQFPLYTHLSISVALRNSLILNLSEYAHVLETRTHEMNVRYPTYVCMQLMQLTITVSTPSRALSKAESWFRLCTTNNIISQSQSDFTACVTELL